jgi:hypothetical protein
LLNKAKGQVKLLVANRTIASRDIVRETLGKVMHLTNWPDDGRKRDRPFSDLVGSDMLGRSA